MPLISFTGLLSLAGERGWPETIILHPSDWSHLWRLCRHDQFKPDDDGSYVLIGVTKFRPPKPRPECVDLSATPLFE